MTYVKIELSPSDVGFAHPLSNELVLNAANHIREHLNGVLLQHDDSETRKYDLRRTHDPLTSSSWIVVYKDNKILITNQIGNEQSQFGALYHGNGTNPICALHKFRRMNKGWGGQWIKTKQRYSEKDGHKSVTVGGRKPVPGSEGVEQQGFLKFFDKRTGLWQYRHCVRPISSAVIKDTERAVKEAVLRGLEQSALELEGPNDYAEEGWSDANTPEDFGMISTVGETEFTFEESANIEESKTSQEKKLEEYRMEKEEEEQQLIDSQRTEKENQDAARDILMSSGLEPPKERGAKVEKKSMWSRFKAAATEVTDSVFQEVHRLFGVTK
jgi:hypothetical protein